MDKKILRTLAVLTVGFGINAVTTNNAAAEMTDRRVPVETWGASARSEQLKARTMDTGVHFSYLPFYRERW